MIKVVIADDSALLRQVLKDVLENSGKIVVEGMVKNGKEAIEAVKQIHPDILILDFEMPVMNGLEALRRIMNECPLPVFIFSAMAYDGATVTIKALEYGAVDFFLKPEQGTQGFQEISHELITQIESIALRSRVPSLKGRRVVRPAVGEKERKWLGASRKIDLIAVGSSIGGVPAAIQIIPKLPITMKPIVWVQHMPPHFTKSFADRLNSLSQISVKEAEDGDILRDGYCYLAPGGFQMKIKRQGASFRIKIDGREKSGGFCPSCDVLFNSVAECFSDNVVGVILTGMGEDGREGLKNMHNRGAFVIGQNESSCVVYGMSRAAQRAGAVDMELDITEIAESLRRAGKFYHER